jgi:hypothetical protein
MLVWDVQTGAAIKTFKNSAILKAVELSQDANVIVSC